MDMQRRIREARERISGVDYLDNASHPGLGDAAAGPSRSLAVTPYTRTRAAYMWEDDDGATTTPLPPRAVVSPVPAPPTADLNPHEAASASTDPLSPHAHGFVVLASWEKSPDEDSNAAEEEPDGTDEENHMAHEVDRTLTRDDPDDRDDPPDLAPTTTPLTAENLADLPL
eukprot:16091833-Heterocapsa_arctica.AAC.1